MKNLFNNLKSMVEGLGDYSRISGNSVSISSSKSIVIIDGEVIVNGESSKEKITIGDTTFELKDFKGNLTINIEGDVKGDVRTYSADVTVGKSAHNVNSTSGEVNIGGDVSNGVNTTSGEVVIEGNVNGSVKTVSGSVRANDISGSVNTLSGSIKTKK